MLLIFLLSGAVSCQTKKSYSIPTDTMEPAIRKGESILVDADAYAKHDPGRGEIIVVQMADGSLVVKRVIAVGGDTIQGKGLEVFVNGKRLEEPYVSHKGPHPEPRDDFGALRVPGRMLFVMGDNRDYSFDSRSPEFGSVPVEAIKGQVVSISQSSDPSRIGRRVD